MLQYVNYILVLIFGLVLSVDIAGGWKKRHHLWWLAPALLAIQGLFSALGSAETVEMLYPLITHLPLFLALWLLFRIRPGMALVSICTAYLSCQLPNWLGLAVADLSGNELAGQICYFVCIAPIFWLLRRFFVKPAHNVMTYSVQSLLLFGSLPIFYYLFDYAFTVYDEMLMLTSQLLVEVLPTAIILFYVVFIAAYHQMSRKRAQAELQGSMLEAALRQSESELQNLRTAQEQAAIYRHDIRHHMHMLHGFLDVSNLEGAQQYIRNVSQDLEAISPRRFCSNEAVNLLCCAFFDRAKAQKVELSVSAGLPEELPFPDTELCSVISNALENALHAVADPAVTEKRIRFYCHLRQGRLLIEITNPYAGQVEMADGLPVSPNPGHGYGCASIRSIVEKHRGLWRFEPENGIFTTRLVLPVKNHQSAENL